MRFYLFAAVLETLCYFGVCDQNVSHHRTEDGLVAGCNDFVLAHTDVMHALPTRTKTSSGHPALPADGRPVAVTMITETVEKLLQSKNMLLSNKGTYSLPPISLQHAEPGQTPTQEEDPMPAWPMFVAWQASESGQAELAQLSWTSTDVEAGTQFGCTCGKSAYSRLLRAAAEILLLCGRAILVIAAGAWAAVWGWKSGTARGIRCCGLLLLVVYFQHSSMGVGPRIK